jgi:Dolichyl-phosphate-mannose-protein mannosyltransferase
MHPDLRTRGGYWIYKAAVASVLICIVYYFLIIIYITLCRIRYPFSLEFAEGDTLIQVYRILQGKMLYAEPSYRYVAMDYPPIYFYISALAARLIGFGFFPLRLVSFISSLGCISIIYLICRKEGTGILPALIASGFFAGTYNLGGAWFDIARVDMLALFLLLLGVYLARLRTPMAYIVAGIIFALSCLTKQTNLFILGILCLYFILFERNKSLGFVISSIACFLLVSLRLDQIFSGWYSFYLFKITFGSDSSSPITPSLVLNSVGEFWLKSLLFAIPIALLLVGTYLINRFINIEWKKGIDKQFAFYLFFIAGMIGASWGALIHQRGFRNSLMPGYAGIAILLGLTLQKLFSDHTVNPLYESGLLFVCMIQFVMLYFPVNSLIPTRKDLLAGQALVSQIQQQPGDVYVHFHPELPLMAGKPTFADWVTTYQLDGEFGGGSVRETNRVKSEFSHAMATQSFSMIILDKDIRWIWGHPEKYYYISDQPVFDDPNVYWPVVGYPYRPTFKMYPIIK